MKKFTLNKKERIKKRKVIEQLFRKGESFSVYPFKVYYFFEPVQTTEAEAENNSVSYLQFGVGAGKRHFKKAVDRNRIKRLTREAFRLQKLPLQNELKLKKSRSLMAFFIFTGKEMPEFDFIKTKMQAALVKLEAQLNKPF